MSRTGRLEALLVAALVAAAGFSITAAAQQLTTLYSFTGSGSGDGANPAASLIADPAGNLYGTTLNGGATVFELTVPASFIAGQARRNMNTKALREGMPRMGRQ